MRLLRRSTTAGWSLLVAHLSLLATIAESAGYRANPAASSRNAQGSNFQCGTEEGYFGDPRDCAVYYRCVDNGNGGPLVRYKFECGPGTVFSSDQGDICTYPDVCGRPECGGTNEQQGDKINDVDSNNTPGTEKEKPGYQGQPESQTSPTPAPTPPRGTCPSCGASHQPAVTRPTTNRPTAGPPVSGPSETDDQTASNAPPSFATECTCAGFMADPYDCAKFYRCVDGGDGSFRRYEFNCGDGTVWDPSRDTCNHPWAANRVGCRDSAGSSPPYRPSDGSSQSTTDPGQGSTEPTMTITWFPGSDPGAESSSATPAPSVSSSPVVVGPSQGSGGGAPPSVGTECTCAGFLADPDDCAKFYRCVDAGNGQFQRYDFNCGEGTVWDPSSETCNHPWAANRVGCRNSAGSNPPYRPSDGSSQSTAAPGQGSTEPTAATNTSPPPGTDYNEGSSVSTPPDSGNPSQGGDSSARPGGEATTGAAAPPDSVDPGEGDDNCDASSGSTGGAQCTTEGFIADPQDCQKFYRCAYEETDTLKRYEFTCGPGTVWDQKLLTCVHPWQSSVPRCQSSGGPTSPPQENTWTDGPPSYQGSSMAPSPEETSTQVPSYEGSSAAPPTEASTEAPSYEVGSSTAPTDEASTEAPSYEGTSAVSPTEASTEAPSYDEGTSTVPPTEQASTEAPSYEGSSTAPPDDEASTEAPSYEGSSIAPPDDEASTEAPSYESSSSTVPPRDEASTEAPSYPPSEVPPSVTASQAPPDSGSSCGSCPLCESEGFFPNEKDCTKFYRCVKNARRGYHRFEFNCGPGTAWDQALLTCTYIDRVAACKGLAKPAEITTSPGSSSSESSTSSSYPDSTSSSDESSTSSSSSTGSSASGESSGGESGSGSRPCDKPTPPTSGNGIACNQEGFYANPNDCGKFYRCVDNGNGFGVYHFDCAPGTIFDPSIGTCNHASAVYPPRNCNAVGQQESWPTPGITERPACQAGAGSVSTETPGCGGDNGGTVTGASTDGTPNFASTASEEGATDEPSTTPENASSPESESETSGATPAAPASEEKTTLSEESGTEPSVTDPSPPASGSVTCPIGNLTGEQIALVCPTGFKRHPKYCNIFYQCTSDDDMSVKILSFHCPDGTIFDEKKIECVPEELSSEPCKGVTAGTRVYRRVEESPMSLVLIEQRDSLCPAEGYYPLDHKECSSVFYKCNRRNEDQTLQGYLYKCPRDFVFWPVSRRCERASRLPMCSNDKSNYNDVEKKENNGFDERWQQLPEETYNRSARKISSS